MVLDRAEINQAAKYYVESAKQFELTLQGFLPKSIKTLSSKKQSFLSLQEHFSATTFLNSFHVNELHEIASGLSGVGLDQFNFVAEGATAQAYHSQGRIVRVGPRSSNNNVKGVQKRWIRPENPIMLQPQKFYQAQRSHIRVEILPYLVMSENVKISDIFSKIVKEVLSGTQFKYRDHSSDVGVLPDGTPICVDPEMIDFVDMGRPVSHDFVLMAENTKKLKLPEPFSWVLPDGRFKQSQFFCSL